MSGQILLQIRLVIHPQNLTHLIQWNLGKFNLPYKRIIDTHGQRDEFCSGTQCICYGSQVFGQQLRGDFFVKNWGVQQGVACQGKHLTTTFNQDSLGRPAT